MLNKKKEPKLFVDFECDNQEIKENPKRKWSIIIEDLLLHLKIGVYPEEFNNIQEVIVNLECDYIAAAPQSNTDTSQILCYATLVKNIQEIGKRNHIYFLENFVEDIANHCLNDTRVRKIKVSAVKKNALEATKSVGVKITRNKHRTGNI